MRYIGDLYGKVNGKYIKLEMTSSDVDLLEKENNSVIAKNMELLEQIKKMKCCGNCKHWKWQDSEDLSEEDGFYYCESKLRADMLLTGECDGWEICE